MNTVFANISKAISSTSDLFLLICHVTIALFIQNNHIKPTSISSQQTELGVLFPICKNISSVVTACLKMISNLLKQRESDTIA